MGFADNVFPNCIHIILSENRTWYIRGARKNAFFIELTCLSAQKLPLVLKLLQLKFWPPWPQEKKTPSI